MEKLANTSIKEVAEPCSLPRTVEEKAEFVLGLANGKGRARLLILLRRNGTMRFNAMQRGLEDISPSLLVNHLSVLSEYGLIVRKQYADVPPKVTYSLTCRGVRMSEFVIRSASVFDRLSVEPDLSPT